MGVAAAGDEEAQKVGGGAGAVAEARRPAWRWEAARPPRVLPAQAPKRECVGAAEGRERVADGSEKVAEGVGSGAEGEG